MIGPANPIAVGAVRYASDWPGLVTTPKELGNSTWTAKRPEVYLDQESEQWPEEATLTLTMPPIIKDAFSDPVAIIKRQYEELQQQDRQELADQGRSFRVMKASPYQRAKSWEDITGLNPRFAVGREQHEARKRAVAALKTFRHAYRAALDLWRAGKCSVQFPRGTWCMATFRGAVAADSG